MDEESERIRDKLRTQSVDPHRVQARHTTHIEDFQRKNTGDTDIAELFHENTKYARVGQKFHRSTSIFTNGIDKDLDEQITPTAARDDLEAIELPEPAAVDESITDAVERRRSFRRYSGEAISLETLSTILKYGCGTLRSSFYYDSGESHLRGYPSAGALYPVEPYLVVVNVSEVPEGVYYYSAEAHELKVIRQMERNEFLETVEPKLNLPQDTALPNVALAFVLSAAFWKTKVKYGPRGYRFALFEAGHLAQNVQMLCASLNLGSCNLGGTDETELDPLIGANGVDESTVYGFVVGKPGSRGETHG